MIVSSLEHQQEEISSIGLNGLSCALVVPAWLNQYQGHQMGSHHKDPMGGHHYIHAHGK